MNRHFNIFWLGQTLSALGDAFALIAMPLLVLQATGSVAQMGLVTGTFGVSQLLAGLFAGVIVDRVDRRRLMILCDIGRMALYATIPLGWWLSGPRVWLIYAVTAGGSLLGMVFQVAYITAVANLVDRERITEANGKLQASAGLAFVLGPLLAGLASARLGPSAALGVDAASFAVSALSLSLVRLRRVAAEHPDDTARPQALADLLAGARFLCASPVLRVVGVLYALQALLTTGGLDLFIFRLKHDLHQSDGAVGLVLGMASVGAIAAGLLAATLRRRWGFGVSWLGGMAGSGLVLAGIGLASRTEAIVPLAAGFTFASTLMGVNSISLRQQITPDHLLGRVTAAFWMLTGSPAPLGAAAATALAARMGASRVLGLMGLALLALTVAGLFTPVRLAHPERAATARAEKLEVA